MKKILFSSLMAIVCFLIASCSSTDTPGQALSHYMDALKNKNYEEVVNGIAFPDKLTPEELQQAKEQWRALLEEKSAKTIEQQGGIAGFEILSEEISEDGNSATVTYKQVFGNGTEDDGTQKMVKKEGKWLMDINK